MQHAQKRRGSLQDGEVEAPPQLPLTDGRHFACRRCRRILSEAQWFTSGCVDCGATMGVPDRDTLLDFATPHFHNFIGLIAPGQSWVARLILKHRAQTNGIFAEKLSDDDDDNVEEDAEMGERLAERYAKDDDGEEEEEEEEDGEDANGAVASEAPAAAAAAAPAGKFASPFAEDGEDDDDDENGILSAPVPSPTAPAVSAASGEPAAEASESDEGREWKRVKTEPSA